MMAAGVEPIKLAIKHVRDGGERMPIAGMHMGKGPGNSMKGEATLDDGIFVDVGIVIVIEESVPQSLAK